MLWRLDEEQWCDKDLKNKHDLKGKPQISVFIVILELKIKSEEKISELWNRGINAVDFLYATNVGFAALSIFQYVKNNDSLFFKVAIVIFCTQGIIVIFYVFY